MIISFTKLNALASGLVQPNLRRACDCRGGLWPGEVQTGGPPLWLRTQMAIGKWRRKVSGRAAESPESGRRFGSIAAVAALGLCLVACQRDEAGATRVGSGQAQRQSIIDFAQTLKDR